LVKVVVAAPLRTEFPGGSEFEIEAATVFELVAELNRLSPGAAGYIEGGVSVAVDGDLVSDWSTSLTRSSEVLLVPHIAGG
jgi:molybdopterin converting factor small subunit